MYAGMSLWQVLFLFCYLCEPARAKIDQPRVFPKVSNFIRYGQSERCIDHSRSYRENLQNFTLWALKMLDASAKNSFGVFWMNSYQFGNFEECLGVEAPFPIQYCLIALRITAPKMDGLKNSSIFSKLQRSHHHRPQRRDAIQIGICVPSSCSQSEIQNSLVKSLSGPFKDQNVTYQIESTKASTCSGQRDPFKRFGVPEIVFCCLTSVLILLSLLGTLVDCKSDQWFKNLSGVFKELFVAFSLKRTWSNLFAAHAKHDQTKIFDSIRTLSMVLIVFGHQGVVERLGPWMNAKEIDRMIGSQETYFMMSIILVVDTFFVLSGFLLSFKMLMLQKSQIPVNPFKQIFLRYLRLTVLLAFVIFLFATVLKYTGSGPLWNFIMRPEIENCRSSWFWSLLYLNNFMTYGDLRCNFPTWFIASDFQLFIFGVFVMFIIGKSFRVGQASLAALLICSLAAPFYVTLAYNIPPVMGVNPDKGFDKHEDMFYGRPYSHASSYIIGIYGGIIYHQLISSKKEISKLVSGVICAVSVVFVAFAFGYLSIFYRHGQRENFFLETAFFNTWNKPLWSAGMLGIFIAVSFGPKSLVTSFLSSSFWIPFSKLTYAVYLIHITVFLTATSNTVTVIRPSMSSEVPPGVANLISSFALGFLLYFFVEAPLGRFLKIFL